MTNMKFIREELDRMEGSLIRFKQTIEYERRQMKEREMQFQTLKRRVERYRALVRYDAMETHKAKRRKAKKGGAK